MAENIKLQELLLPIILKEIGMNLEDIKDGQENTIESIEKLTKAIKEIDFDVCIKEDILDVPSIKRRVKRIEFLTGVNLHSRPIMRDFEEKLNSIIQTSYNEIVNSDMYKKKNCNVTMWDFMTFFPQLRSEGIKIMKSLESKYNIPKASYSINQVKNINALSRTFDSKIIKLLDEQEFITWANNREMEFMDMYLGVLDHMKAGRLLYDLVAKASPEYIKEAQLPYITYQELKDVIRRIMIDEINNKSSYTFTQDYFPFVDRCLQQRQTVTERYIEIMLRSLIV